MMDNPLALLPWLTLGVLGTPVLFAVLTAVAGRTRPGLARRVALNGAVLHLGLTGLLAGACYPALGPGRQATIEFRPIGVPGDQTLGRDLTAETSNHATTWSVLSLGLPSGTRLAPGVPVPDVQFYLGIDGLNLWLIVLASVLNLVAVLASWDSITDRVGAYYAWLFTLLSAVIGAFLAFDVLLFYVFFELTLIPAFFLIGRWGMGGGRRDAARKFFLYTLFGSLLTLVGLIGIVLTNPTPLDAGGRTQRVVNLNGVGRVDMPTAGPITFSIPRLMQNVQVWDTVWKGQAIVASGWERRSDRLRGLAQERLEAAPADEARRAELDAATLDQTDLATERDAALVRAKSFARMQTFFFFLLMCGFAVKIPIVPFHTWLPAAYAEAPIPVTMLLSGVLAKLGTYGVLRVVLPLCPGPALEYGLSVFGTLGAVAIVYGAFCAFGQRDMKRLVAYSSVSHLGLVVIALFSGTSEGLTGATLHMVNHGLSTGAMFALLGFLTARYGTTDMAQYSGLFAKFPAFGVLFMIVSFAAVGVPGLNNFVSEMLMIAGLFEPAVGAYGLATAAAAGIFLSAWYTMTLIRRVFFGPLREPVSVNPSTVRVSLTPAERSGFLIPVALCVLLGLVPQPVIDAIRPDATTLTVHANMARERALPPQPSALVPRDVPLVGQFGN